MFEILRYKVATYFLKKATAYVEKGGFKNLKKSLKYFRLSVSIVPPSKELNKFAASMREDLEQWKQRIEQGD